MCSVRVLRTIRKAEYAELIALFFLQGAALGMWCVPLSTVLNGTHHMPSAAPWRKKSAINSAYSALRIVLSTRTEHMDGGGIQAPSGSGDRLASKPWEALASIQPWYSHRRST